MQLTILCVPPAKEIHLGIEKSGHLGVRPLATSSKVRPSCQNHGRTCRLECSDVNPSLRWHWQAALEGRPEPLGWERERIPPQFIPQPWIITRLAMDQEPSIGINRQQPQGYAAAACWALSVRTPDGLADAVNTAKLSAYFARILFDALEQS